MSMSSDADGLGNNTVTSRAGKRINTKPHVSGLPASKPRQRARLPATSRSTWHCGKSSQLHPSPFSLELHAPRRERHLQTYGFTQRSETKRGRKAIPGQSNSWRKSYTAADGCRAAIKLPPVHKLSQNCSAGSFAGTRPINRKPAETPNCTGRSVKPRRHLLFRRTPLRARPREVRTGKELQPAWQPQGLQTGRDPPELPVHTSEDLMEKAVPACCGRSPP